jgi:Reverse transcriptase (RNA-dependent DNA polymerase)
VFRALYGLRSSGARWGDRLFDVLTEEGFKPSRANTSFWIRPAANGSPYEYIAKYVDDLEIAFKKPSELINFFESKNKFKIKSLEPITYHLGCDYLWA